MENAIKLILIILVCFAFSYFIVPLLIVAILVWLYHEQL